MECELLQSPMISYRSPLYNTTVLYDRYIAIALVATAIALEIITFANQAFVWALAFFSFILLFYPTMY